MCGEAVECVARQFSVWRGSSVCGEALVSDFVDLSRHCEIVLSQRNFNLEQSQLRRIDTLSGAWNILQAANGRLHDMHLTPIPSRVR